MTETGPKMVKIPLFTPGDQVKKMKFKSRWCWEGPMAHMGGWKAHRSGLKAHRAGLKAHQTHPEGLEFEGRVAPSNSRVYKRLLNINPLLLHRIKVLHTKGILGLEHLLNEKLNHLPTCQFLGNSVVVIPSSFIWYR